MAIPVLSGISDALNLYQRNVVDPFAGTALQLANKAKLGLGLGDQGSQTIDQLGPRDALDYAYQDNPWGRFALTSAADPLNFVGLGIPGRLASTGLHALPLIGKGIDALDFLDKVPGQLGGQALDVASHGLSSAVMPLADWAAPHVNRFTAAHPDLSANWMTANLAFKQLAHSVPGYHVTNFADDTSRAAIGGDMNAVKNILTPGSENLMTPWESAMGRTPDSVDTAAALGMGENPQSIFRKASDLDPTTRYWTDPATGMMQDRSLPLQRWLDNAPAPVQWGADKLRALTEKNMDIEANIEKRQRGNVFGSGANDALAAGPGAAAANTLEAMGHPDIAQMVRDRSVVNPDELRLHLLNNGEHPGVADYFADTYGNSLNDAARAGDERVNRLMYNYATPAGASDGEGLLRGIARNTFGGYKFATQNVPFFLRQSVEHPAIVNAPTDYYRNSDMYNYMHGLGSGYHGQMPLGEVAGHKITINPFSASSLVQLSGAMSDKANESDLTPVGQLADQVGELGFGLNPMLKAALTVSGQMGSKQMSDTIRPLTPISAGIGAALGRPVDLEGPVKGALADLEQALTGRQTNSYQDYLVRKRQVELGNADPMRAEDTSGPGHDQAQADVAHDEAIQQLLRTLGVPGYKSMSDEEAQIQQNSRNSQINASRFNPMAALTNPTRGAYDVVDPLQEKISKFATLPIWEQQQLLQDPVARQAILEQRSKLLHQSPGGYTLR